MQPRFADFLLSFPCCVNIFARPPFQHQGAGKYALHDFASFSNHECDFGSMALRLLLCMFPFLSGSFRMRQHGGFWLFPWV